MTDKQKRLWKIAADIRAACEPSPTSSMLNIVKLLEKFAAEIRDMNEKSSHKLVPIVPTETQWAGLARKIIMAWDLGCNTPRQLFSYLGSGGTKIPQWLQNEMEMRNLDSIPSKGTRAAIIYRAMIEDAPNEYEKTI